MAITALRDITRLGVSAFAGTVLTARHATFTIAPAQFYSASVTIADAGVTASSRLVCQLTPTDDWDVDDLADIKLDAEAGAGMFTVHLSRNGPIGGQFKLTYITG